MPRQQWTLAGARPVVEVVLLRAARGQPVTRTLLADTGAGTDRSGFELVLDEQVCLSCGGSRFPAISLGGAFSRSFPVYLLRAQVSQLGFDGHLRAVGVTQTPTGLDGIACFRFLNRFTFGTFGDSRHFGLEI